MSWNLSCSPRPISDRPAVCPEREDLGFDDVVAGDFLGDGVLDLDAGVTSMK